MAFQDKTLTCKECGKEFIFTAGEQEFYAEKGFENEPARCRDCRDKRRRSREGGEQRQMYKVVCADCGKESGSSVEPKTIARCTAVTASPEKSTALRDSRLKFFHETGMISAIML